MDAQLIRDARKLTGESQAAFGSRFRVDQATVHRWEKLGPPSRGPGRVALAREIADIFAAHGRAFEGETTCGAG